MRHLVSIIVSPILVALVYLATGVGASDWLNATSGDKSIDYPKLGIGMLAILVAGLLYAVLTLARLSPLGPVLAGLALFGVSMWATLAASSFTNVVPQNILGVSGAGGWVAGPVGALLAVPLIATIVSPRRWRRWANPPAAAVAPAYSPPPAGGASFPPPASMPQYGSTSAPQYASTPAAYPPPPAPSSVDPTASAWPAPAKTEEFTDPDATRRL